MNITVYTLKLPFVVFLSLCLIFFLTACSGGSGGADPTVVSSETVENVFPPADRTVSGKIIVEVSQRASRSSMPTDNADMTLTMDDEMDEIPFNSQGEFEMTNVNDGNHTLFVQYADGTITSIPFRVLSGRGLGMGTITIRNGHAVDHMGFDGYLFGFIDENDDGINDQFTDADGDGISDMGTPYAGYPYFMDHGYVDEDEDDVNDRFQDADGDGFNDVDGMPYGHGLGYADENADGINDYFIDENGDGICDLTGMPFSHPFGYMDEDNDGTNDRFVDSDGDGVNDITGMHYIAMPGWADLDQDGVNDFFQDADGNGFNDMIDGHMSSAHGFGWIDQDNDGVNDHFMDANGDSINDYGSGPYADMPNQHGFIQAHMDADGNGIDDVSGMPYHHGFGWIDADNDHINDVFMDMDGEGINELTGHHYNEGYAADHDDHDGMMNDEIEWPMPHRDNGMMGVSENLQ